MVRSRAGTLLVGSELKHTRLCFGYVVQNPPTHRLFSLRMPLGCGTLTMFRIQRYK